MKYLLVVALCLLTGCADKITPDQLNMYPDVGFIYGFWHGLIIIPAFVISLFDSSVSLYAAYGNGWPYDAGFIIGMFAVCRATSR
jgi:lysophospholipid acyltransferase (LPLAT)-like uncharacterized protein